MNYSCLILIIFGFGYVKGSNLNSENVTIIVMGRSGAGIKSTVSTANVDTMLGQTAGIKPTEINQGLERALNSISMPESQRRLPRSEMIQLLTQFQSMKLENVTQLPVSLVEKVAFFQFLGPKGSLSYRLLETAFNLKMIEFVGNLVVGNNYDIIHDEMLEFSLLDDTVVVESELGYLIPDTVSCSFLPKLEYSSYSKLVPDFTSYIPLWLELLKQNGGKFNTSNFRGAVRPGFILSPQENEEIVQLSVLKEVRVLECQLNNNPRLGAAFRDSVSTLAPYNESSRENVADWNAFFSRFGTHLVTKAYGGGYFNGMISDPGIKSMVDNEPRISSLFNSMLTFNSIPELSGKTNYSFFGGYKPVELSNLVEIAEKRQYLQRWEDSLKTDPVMLEYDLELEPVSKYAAIIDTQRGRDVQHALEIWMKKKLEFQQLRNRKRPPNSSTASRPQLSTTTPVPVFITTEISRNAARNTTQTTMSQTNLTLITKPCPKTKTAIPILANEIKDYEKNTVGQGYHVIKDVILSTSPLTTATQDFLFDKTHLEKTRAQGWSFPFSTKEENHCIMQYYQRFDNFSQYAMNKMKLGIVETNPNLDPVSVPKKYPTHYIHPGNIIAKQNDTKNAYFPFYAEIRTGRITIPTKLSELLRPDSHFLQELSRLPSLNLVNCISKQEWMDFFDKYGTHIITSAYIGEAREERKFNMGIKYGETILQEAGVLNSTNTCQRWSSLQDSFTVIKSRFSMEFVNLSTLLNNVVRQKSKYDWAYRNLIRDNLECFETRKTQPKNYLQIFFASQNASTNQILQGQTIPLDPPGVENCPATLKVVSNIDMDFKETTVGQGYHVIKDLILPTSPLTPSYPSYRISDNKSSLSIRKPATFEKFGQNKTKQMEYYQRYDNFSDYVLNKMKLGIVEENPNFIPLSVPKNYPTHYIQPGNIIAAKNESKNEYFPIYSEKYSGLIKLNASGLLQPDSHFLQELSRLPSLNVGNCTSKQEWMDFFDKFGTHIITSAYTGEAFETRTFGLDIQSGEKLLFLEVLNSTYIGHLRNSVEPIGNVIRSRFSMTFKSLSSLLTAYFDEKV